MKRTMIIFGVQDRGVLDRICDELWHDDADAFFAGAQAVLAIQLAAVTARISDDEGRALVVQMQEECEFALTDADMIDAQVRR